MAATTITFSFVGPVDNGGLAVDSFGVQYKKLGTDWNDATTQQLIWPVGAHTQYQLHDTDTHPPTGLLFRCCCCCCCGCCCGCGWPRPLFYFHFFLFFFWIFAISTFCFANVVSFFFVSPRFVFSFQFFLSSFLFLFFSFFFFVAEVFPVFGTGSDWDLLLFVRFST